MVSYLTVNLLLIYCKFKFKAKKLHVVNEQTWFLIFQTFFYKTVLDIYDSFFLKINKPNNKFILLKLLVYGTVNKIIVTDNNRLKLILSIFAYKFQ